MKGRIEIISASAGSGKTTRLAGELERAVTELGISPDRLVATTFTKKAAAELIERGRQALLRVGRHDDAELFRAARIGTVNSVAGTIVSDFAFEAGISPELIVLDEVRASEAFRGSLGEVVTRDDLADLARLSGRFAELPWQTIIQEIANATRTNHISLDALDADCEASAARFVELLDGPEHSGPSLDARLETALVLASREIRRRIEEGADKTKKTAETLVAYERAIHRLATHRTLPWPEWGSLAGLEASAKTDPSCEPVRAAARAILRHPDFRADCELAIRLCFGLARRALAAYQRYKTERRAIDFVDQETIALGLLQRDDVKEVLRDEIALVLVDEFQDSSPLQLALFLALARIAPRSVWVGDQKQAIYGFRGADPSLMEAVVGELLGDREPETLGVGRRSRAPLVHLTNALFVPPFGQAGLPAGRVVLEPAVRDDPPQLGPCVERWRLEGQNTMIATAALAASVRHLLDDAAVLVRDRGDGTPRRARPGDVAILCRRRDTCLSLSDRLAELGVDSEVPRVGLMETPEGRVLVAGLRLWVEPGDLLSRAEIARAVDPGSAGIDVLLCRDDPDRLRHVEPVARLLERRDLAPCAGALQAFDAVAESLGLDDLVIRWGRGRQGTANLDALRAHAVSFVRLARHHGGASSPAALVGYFEALASDTADSQAAAGGDDVVAVSTWHKAKGLEWPIVILYELEGPHARTALGVHVDDRRGSEARLEAPLEGRHVRYWPAPFHPNASRTPFHERLRQHEVTTATSDGALREEVRLLYVGWTRARDRLVLASRRDLSTGTLGLLTHGGGNALSEPAPPEGGTCFVERQVTWGGCGVAVGVRRPPPVAARPARRIPVAEVPVRPPAGSYAPARLRPSDVERSGTVTVIARIGAPIALRCETDPVRLGTAIHAFLAADGPTQDADDRAELATRMLEAWGVAPALAVDDLLGLGARFSRWLAERWPTARVRLEWPVEHLLSTGTVVRGTADVVVEDATRLAIVDHKVIVADEPAALESAAEYAGQLDAYREALRAAYRLDDVETLVHLPLSGLVVRVA